MVVCCVMGLKSVIAPPLTVLSKACIYGRVMALCVCSFIQKSLFKTLCACCASHYANLEGSYTVIH